MAVERGNPSSPRKVLVVGAIHGDEPAGIAIVHLLERQIAPQSLDLWLVGDANPDGVAADTRGNADGVDLNRNSPYRWRRLGGVYDSGPRPLSEPESSAIARLVRALRPRISIWFHQHLDLVDLSGGDAAVERRFARLAGLRMERLPRYPGSLTSWENATLPGSTAFVVELPAGRLSAASLRRLAAAVLAVGR